LRRGTDRRRLGNIGLGLFIVSQVLRTHGGTVSVESGVDRGTTFSVRLPRGVEVPEVGSTDRELSSALDLQPARE
jgi:signal transduction histidine kinase